MNIKVRRSSGMNKCSSRCARVLAFFCLLGFRRTSYAPKQMRHHQYQKPTTNRTHETKRNRMNNEKHWHNISLCFFFFWRERTCVTCALTQGGLHTSCGMVLTIPTGRVCGPVTDALWLQGFGVALLTLCLFVCKKQQKETKITIRTSKKDEHAPIRQLGSSAAVSS